MATLIHNGRGALGLPTRVRDGEVVRGTLEAGARLEVPDWYVDELRAERGWARRFADGEVTVVESPKSASSKDTKPKTDAPKADAPKDAKPTGKAKAESAPAKSESAPTTPSDTEDSPKG